jgi:hypothetical protein
LVSISWRAPLATVLQSSRNGVNHNDYANFQAQSV